MSRKSKSVNKLKKSVKKNTSCKKKTKKRESEEKQVLHYVEKFYKGKILSNYIIDGNEIDIYLPELNFAIEFDGLYWHSTEFHEDQMRHYKKLQLCNKKGIKLINIFENEWQNKKPIVCDIIKRNIASDMVKNIHGRQCRIKKIKDPKVIHKFFKNNCINGFSKEKGEAYAIIYNEQIYSMFYVTKKKNNYEILRYVELNGYHVIGGIRKFLSYFKNIHKEKIRIKIDLRYEEPSYWINCGFKYVLNIEPKCYYFDCSTVNHLSLFKLKGHSLKLVIGTNNLDDKSLNETKYRRIYDCGQTLLEF